jgi:NaMN:DMB phosphoribosyltransferase
MEATKLFYLFISGTEISKIPGLSAAGANPEITPLTSPARAWRGYVKEKVGAGISILYAANLGIPVSAMIERTNALYAKASGKNYA